MFFKLSLLLPLASAVSGYEFDIAKSFNLQQDFSCSVSGAGGEDSCDASQAADGSQCVWCSLQSFGVCVSEEQASAMKRAIPGLSCDDDDDDDDAPIDDDDVAPDDDSVPDDYWECLKDYTDPDSCSGGGCTWCSTKGGYGICLDNDVAKKASDSEWFDCSAVIADPYDTSCLMASLSGDEATCEATVDEDGQACEWCSVGSTPLCLTAEQAQIAQQIGGECSSGIADPYDTSCLMASLSGDEATCEATVDEDGQACEWCSVGSTPLCLTAEQAQIAQQIGGDCSTNGLVQ